MSDPVQITTRPYDAKTDESYLYSTWVAGAWHDARCPQRKPFFIKKTKEIEGLIPQCKIIMASLVGDPWFVFGYIVIHHGKLSWIHLKGEKEGFAESGIKDLLLKQLGES